jgi:TetR/AcrR family transcriptional regulator, transcriptional repressor for nem operon
MKKDRSGPRRARLTARGAATRARIVEAAARLAALRGASATSLDEILRTSRASKSQLYHYFTDKDALMCAVVEAQASRVLGFQWSCLKEARSFADLQKWRDKVVELNRASGSVGGCPIGSLASELADRSESARALLADSFRTWEAHFIAGLRAMIEEGQLDSGANPNDLATAAISALQGGLLLAKTTRSTKPLELALDMALGHIGRFRRRG